jgi:hypothetical protein
VQKLFMPMMLCSEKVGGGTVPPFLTITPDEEHDRAKKQNAHANDSDNSEAKDEAVAAPKAKKTKAAPRQKDREVPTGGDEGMAKVSARADDDQDDDEDIPMGGVNSEDRK